MIEIKPPGDKREKIAWNRTLQNILLSKDEPGSILRWLEESLIALHYDNDEELHDNLFKQRQGVAQAISQIIGYIYKSKTELNKGS